MPLNRDDLLEISKNLLENNENGIYYSKVGAL